MLVLMLSIMAWAAPRTAEQAKKIAAEQARKLGITVNEPMLLQKASPKRGKVPVGSTSVEAYYYVFNNNGDNGFTIVSGDDLMPEIVGYSDKGTFSEENMPDNLKAFLKAYCATLEKVVAGNKTATDNVKELAVRRAGETEATVIVEPLLQAITWNQGEPYNNECPLYDGKNRAVTGCVATAMAQIMAYHKYPDALQKDIPTYISQGAAGDINIEGVEAAGRTYDWAHMRDEYDENFSDIEAAAVARLMSDVGRSVNMTYGSESGAITIAPAFALPEYFGYDPDLIQYIQRAQVSLAKWIEIIKHELNEARPVYYGGLSEGGGHAFVCDGYDSADFFHINWGWGGYCNGNFDISVLNPNSNSGAGASSTTDGYDMGMVVVVGIRPDNEVADDVQWKLPSMYVTAEEDAVPTIKTDTRSSALDKFVVDTGWEMYNWSTNDFNGEIGIAAMNEKGELDIICSQKVAFEMNYGFSTELMQKYLPIEYAFPVGFTRLVAVEKPEGGEWTLMNDAIYYSIPLAATETKLSFTEDKTLTVAITNDKMDADNTSIDLDIANKSGLDFYGRLYIYVTQEPTAPEDMPDDYSAYLPLGLDNSGSIKKSVTLPVYDPSKTYYVYIFDDMANLLCSKEMAVNPSSKPIFVLTGYKLNGIPYDELTETTTAQTYWGDWEMPLIHNTGAPELTLDITNYGAKSTFTTTIYNTLSADLMWDWNHSVNISEEIDCGETKTITIPSATTGEGTCIWTLQNIVSNEDNTHILSFGDIEFGVPINDGDYIAYYAYNDGITDGISNIVINEKSNKAIYNLAGQRLKTTKSNGIYIIGKKKVLVK